MGSTELDPRLGLERVEKTSLAALGIPIENKLSIDKETKFEGV